MDGPCDIPEVTIQNALDYIKSNIKPDVVFWTGDNSPHDFYRARNWTKSSAIATNKTTAMIQEAFNDKMDKTFACFGNHDVFPAWNINEHGNAAASQSMPLWKPWMDDEAYQTFVKTGYYSQKLDLGTGKLIKVITLNTEAACDMDNPYVYGQLNDPNDQIKFLMDELNYLEQNSGSAFIVGHVLPDDGCTHDFSVRLRAILERYQHIIKMTVFGHNHNDLVKVAMSYSQPETPVGYIHSCGSMTTWGGNPQFCVYEVDAETLLPVNRYTYSFDMIKANQ